MLFTIQVIFSLGLGYRSSPRWLTQVGPGGPPLGMQVKLFFFVQHHGSNPQHFSSSFEQCNNLESTQVLTSWDLSELSNDLKSSTVEMSRLVKSENGLAVHTKALADAIAKMENQLHFEVAIRS